MEMRATVNGQTQEGRNGAQEAFHSGWWLLAGLAAKWLPFFFFVPKDDLNFNISQVSYLEKVE